MLVVADMNLSYRIDDYEKITAEGKKEGEKKGQ